MLVALMGIPGSGKSTLAAAISQTLTGWGDSVVVLCPDDIREEVTGSASDQSRNREVFELAHDRLRTALTEVGCVIFDATNVTIAARQSLLQIAAECGSDTCLYVVDTPHEVSRARNLARSRTVPEHAMNRLQDLYAASLSAVQHEGWGKIVNVRPPCGG